ncbi:MAG: DNA primase [Candidatus Fonsibacter sp.]|jgi:DNA primase|nr:DNA primase [Candidatus Fonsibacter sp.]
MKFPKEYLEEIKQRIKVSDIVGASVQLKRRGREFVGLSPFSKEKTPSFTINDEKGFYHCFSSGEHGNIFDFLVKVEKLNFGDAVRKLAAKAGMPAFKFTKENIEVENKRKKYDEILTIALQHYQKNFSENDSVKKYAHGRGLTQEILSTFKIGYSGEYGLNVSLFSGFNQKELIESGVFFHDEKNNKLIDRFKNRLIFPIFDYNNKVIGFGGRALSQNYLAKYINSPETEFFKKGFNLYNLNNAKNENKQSGIVFVVEGYMDAISLYQAGFKNVVATLGTAMTESHLNLVWRYFNDPVVCFDGDRSGQNAAHKISEKLIAYMKPNYSLSFLILPNGFDPDSFVRKNGRNNFESLLDQKIDIGNFIFENNLQDLQSEQPEERAGFEKKIMDLCLLIQDSTVKKHYISFFKNKIFEQFSSRKAKNLKPLNKTKELTRKITRYSSFELKEFSLMYFFLNNIQILKNQSEKLSIINFHNKNLEELKKVLINILEKIETFKEFNLLKHLEENNFGQIIKDINEFSSIKGISENLNEEKFDNFLNDLIEQVNNLKLESKLKDAEESLSKNMNEAQYNELLSLKDQIVASKKV